MPPEQRHAVDLGATNELSKWSMSANPSYLVDPQDRWWSCDGRSVVGPQPAGYAHFIQVSVTDE